jgi:hypothetical protein
MRNKELTPAEARKTWQNSTVASPVALCRRICEKYPNKSNKDLIKLCEDAGISRSTASVQVSRFKSARK